VGPWYGGLNLILQNQQVTDCETDDFSDGVVESNEVAEIF
jgi:hypothetical protein